MVQIQGDSRILVFFHNCIPILFIQGLESYSWNFLYSSVMTEFFSRNILKQPFSDQLIFQVFCIKQLLKNNEYFFKRLYTYPFLFLMYN